MSTPQLAPYTPRLNQPDAYGRYRQYPRVATAPIPGVGYDVGKLAWAEQELNLDGGGPPTHYGSYRTVPLRGLGAVVMSPSVMMAMRESTVSPVIAAIYGGAVTPPPTSSDAQEASGPAPSESTPEQEEAAVYDAAAVIEQAARAAEAAAAAEVPAEPGFFAQKVGPVPVWALLLGGVAVVGGGAWWYTRKK
jgi:hypothetical protein